MSSVVRRATWLVLFGLLWEAASRWGPWPRRLFAGPTEVLRALGELWAQGDLMTHLGRTLGRLALGYVLSVAIGIPLGLLLGRSRLAHEALAAPVVGLQALPSVCWLPLAALWFGLSETAIVFVVIMGSALAVAIASEAGVRNLNPLWLRAARTLGARGASVYTTVLLPASLPALLSGARLGWSFAWRSLMGAELLYAAGGLGQLLHRSRQLNDVPRMFAVMVLITVVGVCADRLVFAPLERRVRTRFGLETDTEMEK